MAPSIKLEDKLEGIENFRAWKYRIGLILQENDLDKYVKEEVSEPEEAEAKEKHIKYMIRAQRIIVDFVKCHPRRLQNKCMMPFPKCMREETSTGR